LQFYETLRAVFLKYAKVPAAAAEEGAAPLDNEAKARKASLGREQMNAFSKATNGAGASLSLDLRTCTDGAAALRLARGS